MLVGFGIKLELIIRRIFDVLKIYFRLENKLKYIINICMYLYSLVCLYLILFRLSYRV